jgi:hypothetical protein
MLSDYDSFKHIIDALPVDRIIPLVLDSLRMSGPIDFITVTDDAFNADVGVYHAAALFLAYFVKDTASMEMIAPLFSAPEALTRCLDAFEHLDSRHKWYSVGFRGMFTILKRAMMTYGSSSGSSSSSSSSDPSVRSQILRIITNIINEYGKSIIEDIVHMIPEFLDMTEEDSDGSVTEARKCLMDAMRAKGLI